MKRSLMFVASSIASVLGVCGQARADLTVKILPSLAPSPWALSGSWDVWRGRALIVIGNYPLVVGVGSQQTDPAACELLRLIGPNHYVAEPGDLISSIDFTSWKGRANPTAPFFELEQGTYVAWGVSIVGGGTNERFSKSQVVYAISGDDPAGIFNYAGSMAGEDYSSLCYGIDYGGDGKKGGGDDVLITSGPPNQEIDELVHVGVMSGYETECVGTNFQAALNTSLAYFSTNAPVNITCTYEVYDGVIRRGTSTATLTVRDKASVPGSTGMGASVIAIKR